MSPHHESPKFYRPAPADGEATTWLRGRPFISRRAAMALLFALAMSLLLLALIFAQPVRADGGGFVTSTPTFTLVPTFTPTFIPTATTDPYPAVQALPLILATEVPTPTVVLPAPQTGIADRVPIGICGAIALVLILVGIIGGATILRQR